MRLAARGASARGRLHSPCTRRSKGPVPCPTHVIQRWTGIDGTQLRIAGRSHLDLEPRGQRVFLAAAHEHPAGFELDVVDLKGATSSLPRSAPANPSKTVSGMKGQISAPAEAPSSPITPTAQSCATRMHACAYILRGGISGPA